MSIWDLTNEDRGFMTAAGYSDKALDLYSKREYRGDLMDANVCHTKKSSSGQSLRFCIKVEGDRITSSTYSQVGCPALAAAAAAVIELLSDRTVHEAETIMIPDIWRLLESLPPGHEEQVKFSIDTLRETLEILRDQKRLSPEQHENYKHLCGATEKELGEMDIELCPSCFLIQNCENDHITV